MCSTSIPIGVTSGTGFTLDKESNTIAIICEDVTVVLAFDTRERLIQWQVKIASSLGEGIYCLLFTHKNTYRAILTIFVIYKCNINFVIKTPLLFDIFYISEVKVLPKRSGLTVC